MGQSASPDLGTLADAISKQPAIDWIDPLHRLCVDLMLQRDHGIAVRYLSGARRAVHLDRAACGWCRVDRVGALCTAATPRRGASACRRNYLRMRCYSVWSQRVDQYGVYLRHTNHLADVTRASILIRISGASCTYVR